MQNRDKITLDSKFSEIEESLLFEIAPADIHLKYLFLETDVLDVISCVVSSVFDKKVLDKKLIALMKNEGELDFILDYATDPDNFKK
ncbi:hypothetical protein IKI14_03280 [bacterium]|nr:hypothetical protein [bacterium]